MLLAEAASIAARATNGPPSWFGGMLHPSMQKAAAYNGNELDFNSEISGEALTVALDVVQAWAVFITLGFTLIIFIFLAFCVCTKKDDSYDEYELSQGVRTVKFCQNAGEHLNHAVSHGGSKMSTKVTEETSEASSRYTAKRELPAIPKTSANARGGSNVTSSQTGNNSKVDGVHGASGVKLVGGVQVLPTVAHSVRSSTSVELKHSDQDKMSKPQTHRIIGVNSFGKSSKNGATPKNMNKDTSKIDTDEKTSERKEEKLVVSSALITSISSQSTVSGSVDVQALNRSVVSTHSAIISASRGDAPIIQATSQQLSAGISQARVGQEASYMIPPAAQESGQYFSGDSQDSRGYTSISVREPLSALKARQGHGANEGAIAALGRISSKNGSQEEGHYTTVSDDSTDDTYASIYESRSTSETYAQIEPRPKSQTGAMSTGSVSSVIHVGESVTQEQAPPAPPSVGSLKNVVHSRQASAGSSASTGMGSPVAEKRQTKSPLPPLPQGDVLAYSICDHSSGDLMLKSPQKTSSSEKLTAKSIDEMYAKVNKKTGHSRIQSDGESILDTSSSALSDKMSHSMVETGFGMNSSIPTGTFLPDVVGKDSPLLYSSSDAGYETVKNSEPNYASLGPSIRSQPGYETVRDLDSEPGYEILKHTEPGYETLQGIDFRLVSEPGYETVKSEPGYESVKSEPGYETVKNVPGLESDPGYEVLGYSKNGRPISENDPNYEQLKFIPEIPKSLGNLAPTTEGNYERVSDYITQEKLDGVPLYASIKKKASPKLESAAKKEAFSDLSHRIMDIISPVGVDEEKFSYECEETVTSEGVEFPPPGDENNHRVSPSSPESVLECAPKIVGFAAKSDEMTAKLLEDFPPPPMSTAGYSDSPPPPPVVDELGHIQDFPPPPMSQKMDDSILVNHTLSDSRPISTFSALSQPSIDLPPPPLSDIDMCNGVHVTVNPMDDFKEEQLISFGGEPSQTLPEAGNRPPSPLVSAGGDSGDSSGSTQNGNDNSIESVVTVTKQAGESVVTGATVASQKLQHSASISSTDSKHSDHADPTPV